MAANLTKFAGSGNPSYRPPAGPTAGTPALDKNFSLCILADGSQVISLVIPPYANLSAFMAAISALGYSTPSFGMTYYDESLFAVRIYRTDGQWVGLLSS